MVFVFLADYGPETGIVAMLFQMGQLVEYHIGDQVMRQVFQQAVERQVVVRAQAGPFRTHGPDKYFAGLNPQIPGISLD